MAPLLDESKLCARVTLGHGAERACSVSDSLPLRLTLYLTRAAFDASAAAATSDEGTPASAAALAASRYALVRLLDRLRVRPVLAAAASAPTKLEELGTKSCGGGSGGGGGSWGGSGGGGGVMRSTSTKLEAEGEDGDLGAAEVDDLYGRMSSDPSLLEPLDAGQPSELLCTLHPYQRQALGWMLWREKCASERRRLAIRAARGSSLHALAHMEGLIEQDGGALDGAIHPAWAKYAFASVEPTGGVAGGAPTGASTGASAKCPVDVSASAGVRCDASVEASLCATSVPPVEHFYVNASTGAAALTAPGGDEAAPRGGLLADEMGLGKTVEVIALILADLEGMEVGERAGEGVQEPVREPGREAVREAVREEVREAQSKDEEPLATAPESYESTHDALIGASVNEVVHSKVPFVEEHKLPFAEEHKLPFAEEHTLPFAEEHKLPFAEEHKLPFAEEHKLPLAEEHKLPFDDHVDTDEAEELAELEELTKVQSVTHRFAPHATLPFFLHLSDVSSQ
jgi:hypothetical protein